ncbi:hypothetical protein RUND412_000729 [Rhizina undulata]
MRPLSLLSRFARPTESLCSRQTPLLLCAPSHSKIQWIRPSLPIFAAPLSTTSACQSGHNRWSKIKHDKGKADARRGASFSKLSQEMIQASRTGGPDTSSNLRLAAAIAAAKKAGMAKAHIESAISRGQGVSAEGTVLESVLVECMGPGSVAILVDCLTDNKLRTLQDVKHTISRNHATATPTSYLFTKKGVIRLQPGGIEFDTIFESSLEIEGTEDVEEVSDEEFKGIEVTTDPTKTFAVTGDLKKKLPGIEIISSGIEWIANDDTKVSILDDSTEMQELITLIDALESNNDVNEVYTNLN